MPVYEDKKAKDKSQKYYINVYYTDEFGKRKIIKKRGFANKTAAREAENEIKHDLKVGTLVKKHKTLFGDMVKEWLEDKRGTVKDSTFGIYANVVDNHIVLKLGHYEAMNLTHRIIQDFINEYKKNKTLSEENVRKVYMVINTVLERAVEWGQIKKNVAKKIELPKIPKRKPDVWDMNEAWTFLEVAREDRYYPAFLLALTTGMRQGEILGLRRTDLDLNSGTLKIEQALTHNGKKLEEPKTNASERIVQLDEITVNELRKQYNRIVHEKNSSAPDEYKDYGLLICTTNGTPVIPRNLMRTYYRLLKKAKLRNITFHDLRHCHATYLLLLNQHPKKVAERLGHADSRMMDRYSHVSPIMHKQTAIEFGQAFYNIRSS